MIKLESGDQTDLCSDFNKILSVTPDTPILSSFCFYFVATAFVSVYIGILL